MRAQRLPNKLPTSSTHIVRRVRDDDRRVRVIMTTKSSKMSTNAHGSTATLADAATASASKVAIASFLTKRGGKDLYGKPTWRLRFFALRRSRHARERSVIRYFANEPADASETAAKGEFVINGKSSVRVLDAEETFTEFGLKANKFAGKRMFAFQTLPSDGNSGALVVEAENLALMQRWVTAISDAIAAARAVESEAAGQTLTSSGVNAEEQDALKGKNFRGTLELAGLCGPLGGGALPVHLDACWENLTFVDLMADSCLNERLGRQHRPKYVRETLSALVDSAITVSRCLSASAIQMSGPESNAMGSIRRALEDMLSMARLIPVGTKDNNLFVSFLSAFLDRVKQLRAGELMMVPGGWANADGGAAVIYTIHRLPAHFVVSLTNCGDGLEYHPMQADPAQDAFKYIATVQLMEVPIAVAMDSSTWALLFRPLVFPHTAEKAKDMIYNKVLPMMNSRPLLASVTPSPLRTVQFAKRPRGLDASGVFTALEAARCGLASLGCPPSRADALVNLGVRHVMLEEAKRDLERVNMIGASALVTLQAACRTVSDYAATHAELLVAAEESMSPNGSPNGTSAPTKTAPLSRDTLAQILRSVEAVMQKTKALHAATTLPPPLAPTKLPPTSCAVPLFNRLAIEGNVDALAGAAKAPPILRPVELTMVPDAIDSLEQVPKALRNALHCCTILANQADLMPNSYALRVSLLVHLFVHVLPAPMPLTHPERATKCFWASSKATYEIQAEILRSLNLLLRHFSAAVLSISVTQTFDAARLLTIANFAAIADATLRLKVADAPSAFIQHYAGYAEGPISAFGFEIGPFAVEAEYLRFHCPERTARLTQILDYFHSLKRTISKDHMIYRWEDESAGGMSFGVGEARLIDQVCLQMGISRDVPEYLAKYHTGEHREFVDSYPEMRSLRDILFMFKLLMAPTSDALPELARWKPIDAALDWSVTARDGFFDLTVSAFGRNLAVQPWKEPELDEGGKLRTGWRNVFGGGFFARITDRRPRCPPSGANPSNLAGSRIDTEEDVLHLPDVPTFDNLLKQSESELLLTYLTAPMIRLPLVMKLFSDPTRVRGITHRDIQSIIDAVMFEPGPWSPPEPTNVPKEIPAPTRAHMATPSGLLIHELIHCPAPLVDSAEELLALSLELDTGRHDAPSAQGVLFATRMLSRMLAFVSHIIKSNSLDTEFSASTGITRGLTCSSAAVSTLKDVKLRIKRALGDKCTPVLKRWLGHAVKKNAIRPACALHAHLAYMYYWTPRDEIDKQAARTILTAQQYIFVNYSFADTPDGSAATDRKLADASNMSGVDTGLGFVPTEIFDLFQRKRRSVLEWAAANPKDANQILEEVVDALTTKKTDGSRSPTNVLDSDENFKTNRAWRRAPGAGGAGRFVSYVSDIPFNELVARDKQASEELLRRHVHYGEWLLETTMQTFEMEINTQLGEFTVRKNRLGHLEASIREMPDFIAALGPVLSKRGIESSHFHELAEEETLAIGDSGDVVHCAEVQNTEHRKWMRLVGLGHDIQLWDRDPRPPMNEFTRPYVSRVQSSVSAVEALGRAIGSGGLEPCEQWITQLLEPIARGPGAGFLHGVELFLPNHTIHGTIARLAGTGAPDNAVEEPWSFFRRKKKTNDADQAKRVEQAKQLLTEVVIVQEPPLVQVFRVESYGRRWRRSLVFASNASFCLADIDPDGEPLLTDPNERFLLSAARLGSRAPSLVVTRLLHGAVGRESFVPARHLRGLLPAALLEEYQFWRSETTGDLFGTAQEGALHHDTMIHVRLGYENNTLLDGKHPIDTCAVVRRLPVNSLDDASNLPLLDGSYVEGQVTLVDLLYAPGLAGENGKSLLLLTKSLAAVEGLAHALVWTAKRGLENGPTAAVELCDIARIELPRLGVSFNAVESGGSIRLECEEHAGLFLAQRRNPALEGLLAGLPHALLLEARDGALSVLLPAGAIPRPAAYATDHANAASTGLGSDLVIDRWNSQWVENIGSTRHYVYPVHPSHSVISATTLASALYLSILRFVGRSYLDVLRLAELCVSEALPSPEEAQLWDALAHAASLDPSPDATAVRVKLALMVQGTPIEARLAAKWPPVADVLAYINAWPYISAQCRLTGQEELSAIENLPSVTLAKKRAKFRISLSLIFPGSRKTTAEEANMDPAKTPELLNRAAYLRQLVSGIARMSAGATPTSSGFPLVYPQTPEYSQYDTIDDLTCLEEKVYGEGPLGKLAGLIQTYNRPDDVSVNGAQALALIGKWIDNEKFNLDGNLGFPLFFELLTGTLPMRILPGDTPHRWGNVLLRFVPTEQSMKRGTLMSTLRMLASNPALAVDCPKIEEQSVGQRFTSMFTSDGAIGVLLRRVRPYLQQRKDSLPFRQTWVGKSYIAPTIYESDVKTWARTIATGGRWALTRFSNTSCSEREFPLQSVGSEQGIGMTSWSGKTLQHVDLNMLVHRPLGVLDLNKYVVPLTEDRSDQLAEDVALGGVGGLPFDVSRHPSATTSVARQMLTRLRQDVTSAAEKAKARKDMGDFSAVTLKGFTPSDTAAIAAEAGAGRAGTAAGTARAVLRELLESIRRVTADDKAAAAEAMSAALATANGLRKDAESGTKMLRLGLQRRAGAWAEVTFEDLVECLTCEGGEHILSRLSPGVTAAQIVNALHLASQSLLLTLRATLAARAAAMVADTLIALTNCAKTAALDGIDSVDRDLRLRALAIAELLSVERHYFHADTANPFNKATTLVYDPRLLVYEYSQSIVLRKRQVELTRDFVNTAELGGGQCAQMLMGEGKTTVVCPLLGFLLAKKSSIVVQVVPHALLEFSRSTLRKSYSGMIRRSVVTLEFNRYTSLSDGAILAALRKAQENRAIVIASPTSIKSLALKFLEVCHLLDQSYIAELEAKAGSNIVTQGGDFIARVFGGAKSRSERVADAGGLSIEELDVLRSEAQCAAEIFEIFQTGTLILDEVDLILHPLKSELNWPMGRRVPLDFSQSASGNGLRWKLPYFILDAIFAVAHGSSTVSEAAGSQEASDLLDSIRDAINAAVRNKQIQSSPHLAVLDRAWYHDILRPLLAQWSSIWLRAHGALRGMSEALVMAYLLQGPGKDEAAVQLNRECDDEAIKMTNLARDWLCSLLPHLLAKVDRVTYGLLQPADVELLEAASGARIPRTRRLLAVPFVGKDIPSRTNEFSHPDVVLGLTICAYRLEGLRRSDFKQVLRSMIENFDNEAGPPPKRASARLWADWVRTTGKRVRGERRAEAALNARRRGVQQQAGLTSIGDSRGLAFLEDENVSGYDDDEIWPLQLIDLRDHDQVEELYQLLRRTPPVVEFYLNDYVFPETAQHQNLKLSATGQELGGNVLFPTRLGFSGTPSDLLPLELGAPRYEPGSDAKMLAYLTDPQTVTPMKMLTDWNVEKLLTRIATADPPIRALIDTGALVTGMSNLEVARFLLEKGLKWAEGCVFLDENDRQMILMRKDWNVIPLQRVAAMPMSKRFTFYDQVHTTGMDIKQSAAAQAAITLGKDMCLRDYAQGAWRMRGLGRGQTLQVVMIPEVARLISVEVSKGGGQTSATREAEIASMSPDEAAKRTLRDITAWLVVNSMRSENVQAGLLAEQRAANIWRKHSYRKLIASPTVPGTPRAQQTGIQAALDVFRERVSYVVANVIPKTFSPSEKLNMNMQQFGHLLDDNPKAKETLRKIVEDVQHMENATNAALKQIRAGAFSAPGAAMSGDKGLAGGLEHVLDLEQVQENEEEQENEQEQEQEKEEEREEEIPEEVPDRLAYSRDDERQLSWSYELLAQPPNANTQGFYPLNSFKIHKGVGKTTAPLAFPDYLQLSRNYFRQGWALNSHRRLKNLTIVLDWVPDSSALTSDTSGTLGVSNFTAAQESALRTAFDMFDSKGNGRLQETDLREVLREIDACVEDDELRLHQLAREVAEDARTFITGMPSSGTSFEELKRVLRQKNIYSLQRGRYYVALSLAEAESLRVVMHLTQSDPTSDGKLIPFKLTETALRIGGGTLIDTTSNFTPAQVFQGATAEQCFRFLDSQMDFEDREVSLLLRALQASPCDKREQFFESVRACRRRAKIPWAATPLAKVLTTPDEFHLLASRALVARVRTALKAKRMRLLDAFRAFDSENIGRLTYEALYGGLSWLGLSLTSAQMLELAARVDKTGDGYISRQEFEDAFGPDDDWILEGDAPLVTAPVSLPTQQLAAVSLMDILGDSGSESGSASSLPTIPMPVTKIPLAAAAPSVSMPAPPPKIHSTANMSIDDGTGLGDWGALGMAATLPTVKKVEKSAVAPKPTPNDPFGLGPPAAAASSAFDDWLSGGSGAMAGGGSLNDPLSAVTNPADGWEGNDIIQLDTSTGTIAAPTREKIQARALVDPAKEAADRRNNQVDSKLTSSVLNGFEVTVAHQKTFSKVWTSDGTGSRDMVSIWDANVSKSTCKKKTERVSLGHYASPHFSAPKPAPFGVDVTDINAFALTGSNYMPRVLERLLPFPSRFRQVWGQEWKSSAVYAWAPVPPPGFVALGMILTTKPQAPHVSSVRCLPEKWAVKPSMEPQLVWTNEGSGGRPASIWLVNSLGLLYVNAGHNPPAARDLWDIRRGKLSADMILEYRAGMNMSSTYGGTGISSNSFNGPTYRPPPGPTPSQGPPGLGSLL